MATTMGGATQTAYHGFADETVQITEVPIASIVMPGFQRERKAHHIAKIAAEWDATAYVFPIVAYYKDRFVCIDGQQRVAAAEKREMLALHVLVIEGVKSVERLATIYLHVNRDRKLLNAFEKYVGALGAKDRGTVNIKRIVSGFDLEVSKSASASGKIPAGAVAKIHEQGGSDLLERVLKVREEAWGSNPSREANEGKTLAGIAGFLRRYWDKVDDGRLIEVMSKHHPGYILQAIDQRRGMSQTMTYADYLREQYNKGRRGKAKL